MTASTIPGAVAAVERLGAEAAASALRSGGNAADAAVAGSFAQCVVDPWRCSIAGAANILYFDARTGETVFIDAGGYAPRKATSDMYEVVQRWENAFIVKDGLNRWGYLAQVVPGFVRGMQELHERFGSRNLSWADLLAPAARLAEEGFPVHPHLARAWQRGQGADNPLFGDSYKALSYTAESRRIFLHDDGSVYRTGEILRQADLGTTLRRLQQAGPEEFYEGEIAAAICRDFAANGGLLDAVDLKDYRPSSEVPLEGRYRGVRVVTQTAPSVGPTMLQILAILDGWDLAAMGHHSPEHVQRLADTIYLAFVDRDEFVGDPHVVGDTFRHLIDPARIARQRAAIEEGDLEHFPTDSVGSEEPHDTTHIATIDAGGNMCGITHSVGAGTGIVTPGLGFMHNCHMTNYDPRPGMINSIAPGKRGTGGGAPVFLFSDDGSKVSLGSPAGTFKASGMPQVISNHVDFGMSLSESVSADRIHIRSEPRLAVLDDRFDPRAALALAAHGYDVSYSNYSARIVACGWDADLNSFSTGSDVRGDRGEAIVGDPLLNTSRTNKERKS